jgi:RNA polymerase sigma-70 factor (ECF subfamily)
MLTRTTTALLEGLTDPEDEAAWQAFDARFRPVIVAFARRLGLEPEDAADAAQDTLARFLRSFREGRYDRDRGRLGAWIIGIARHCIADHLASRARRREQGLSSAGELADDAALTRIWERECERQILHEAVGELRRVTRTDPRTVRVFEMLAFDQRRPAEIARELGISTNDVYLAKHRCLKRLRSIISELEQAFER